MSINKPGRDTVARVFLPGIVFIIILLVVHYSSLSGEGDRAGFDFLIRLRVNERNAKDKWSGRVFSIDLNDRAERTLADSIHTRDAFAETLKVLRENNAAVVLDFLFPYKKEADGKFLEAVKNSKDIILAIRAVNKDLPDGGFHFEDLTAREKNLLLGHLWKIKTAGEDAVPEAWTFSMSYEDLNTALKLSGGQLGFTNMEPEYGKYRQVPLLYKYKLDDGSHAYLPSLVLAAAVKYLGVDTEKIEFYPGFRLRLPLADGESIDIPVDKRAYMYIPYISAWTGNEFGFGRYMDDLVLKQDDAGFPELVNPLNNTVAFVADLTSNQKDVGIVPFADIYPLSQIHITVLESILDGTYDAFIYHPPFWLRPVLSLALLLLVLFISSRQKIWRLCLCFCTLFLLFSAGILLLWHIRHYVPWYTAPAAALSAAWITALVLRLVTMYGERQRLENALSVYFAPAMTKRIMKEGVNRLRPQYKVISFLFSDIVDFTFWSRDKDAKTVYTFLSFYHQIMEEVVFSHNGTIDKFLGDGMLGLFGTPYNLPDHNLACLKAAFDMQRRVRELSNEWKGRFKKDLQIRIGINSGKVFVGNLGEKNRIDYTVFGSAVNLAQRMEAAAPRGGILVTKEFWDTIGKDERKQFSEGREGALTRVKGYRGKKIEVVSFRYPYMNTGR